MTKEEKQARKKRRCEKRRINNDKVIDKAMHFVCEYGVSLKQAKSIIRCGTFLNTEGKEMQTCSWKGLCFYPCNGDC